MGLTATSHTPLIAATGLAIGYPGQAVGSGITLAVHSGEVLCLLGPNGSGKTTLFKTLLGLIPAQGGTVTIGDGSIDGLDRAEIARRVSYVPQAHAAHFPYRVLDMVTMGRTAHLGLFAKPGRHDRECAEAALASLGIADLASREYTRISGGQRQLVLIARALAQNAPAIVLDEPTASLDFGNQVRVLSEVKRLAARGLAIVLSTHDPDHAFGIADRVVFLHDGQLIASGKPEQVLTASRLEAVYEVKVCIETLAGGQRVCAPDLGPAISSDGQG
ncbi:MAG: ABC transporter ATP-binding protein [Hyphomicrobiaceae bacterium]|nr:ABC transporter ATP-binding protein [Hyphomicrobiaceae bacterium]